MLKVGSVLLVNTGGSDTFADRCGRSAGVGDLSRRLVSASRIVTSLESLRVSAPKVRMASWACNCSISACAASSASCTSVSWAVLSVDVLAAAAALLEVGFLGAIVVVDDFW